MAYYSWEWHYGGIIVSWPGGDYLFQPGDEANYLANELANARARWAEDEDDIIGQYSELWEGE